MLLPLPDKSPYALLRIARGRRQHAWKRQSIVDSAERAQGLSCYYSHIVDHQASAVKGFEVLVIAFAAFTMWWMFTSFKRAGIITRLFFTVVVTAVLTFIVASSTGFMLVSLFTASPPTMWAVMAVLSLLFVRKLFRRRKSPPANGGYSPSGRDPSGNDAYNPSPPKYTQSTGRR
jgi:hypothetical protein